MGSNFLLRSDFFCKLVICYYITHMAIRMSRKDSSEMNTFKVIPSKLIFIAFSHAFALIVAGHIIIAIISGIDSLKFIPFLLLAIFVFILMSLAVLVQIKNTYYSVYPDKLLFKAGLRKERKILWNEIESIKHIPFKPTLTVLIKKILKWFKPMKNHLELADWYKVTWDDEYIYRSVTPPDKEAWKDSFRWKDIIRICFEATDYLYPDDIYFFTSQRPESYLIPSEAKGAPELWEKVIEKGLFDPELAVKVATAVSGMFCWPKEAS